MKIFCPLRIYCIVFQYFYDKKKILFHIIPGQQSFQSLLLAFDSSFIYVLINLFIHIFTFIPSIVLRIFFKLENNGDNYKIYY